MSAEVMATLVMDAAVPTATELRSARLKARERFARARRAESSYAAQLHQVARHVGDIIKGFAPAGTIEDFVRLRDTLYKYGELLVPWAQAVSARMLEEVARRDAQAWVEYGQTMGRALAVEIRSAPTGEMLKDYLNTQVDLITSLPRDAAERVHKLTMKGMTEGVRKEVISDEIMRTGLVTRSRADLIARTEVARTATALTMVRSKHVGSEMFIWRTALDADVRPTHRVLEGKAFRWDEPPVTETTGEHALPGGIWNCRCYPEPILPDEA